MKITLANFEHDMHGAGGILAGLREAAATPGTIARFIVQVHPAHADKVLPEAHVSKVVEVGLSEIDGRPTWRYASGGDLLGSGSHGLIPSWYDDQTIEHAAATLGYALARYCGEYDVVFRDVADQAQQVAA
jgi:hypothetical protein